MQTVKPPNNVVRLKLVTRPKLDRIRREKRWSLAETVDALADEYLARQQKRQPSA